MRLSFQTVCIIFGVTLVHLIIIATLSPVGSEGERYFGPVPDLIVEGTGPEEAATHPEPNPLRATDETYLTPRPDAVHAVPAEPIDLPARRREDASAPIAPAADPVAATRPVPQSPRS